MMQGRQIRPMRLALALAAVVTLAGNGAGWAAGKGPCIARAHPGAVPYYSAGSEPADTSHGSNDPGPNDAEVAGIDRDAKGQEWVYRVHEFAWRRQDVTLRGDCSRVR